MRMTVISLGSDGMHAEGPKGWKMTGTYVQHVIYARACVRAQATLDHE